MSLNLKLLHDIWCFRNSVLHGSTRKEQHILERERVTQQVKTIHQSPPKLSTRFTPVNALPLDIRLRSSTLTLQRWVSRMQHQKTVTLRMQSSLRAGQLSTPQAFARLRPNICDKYPP